MKYSEKLKDPRWQKKRLEIFERDEWFCRKCGDDKATLAVHHLFYRPNTDPWDYPNEDLLTLCEECHSEEYEGRPEAERVLLNELKSDRYFHADIINIAYIFAMINKINPPFPNEVIVDVLSWAITGDEIGIKNLCEQYFEHLKNRRIERESIKAKETNGVS